MTERTCPTNCQNGDCPNAFVLDDDGCPQYKTIPVIQDGKVVTRYFCPACWQAWRDSVRAKLARKATAAAATLLLAISIGTVSAQAAPQRPPRNPQPQEERVAPRPAPRCEWNRYNTPRNCNPERRPHDRSVPR